jgi:hypothetical protein
MKKLCRAFAVLANTNLRLTGLDEAIKIANIKPNEPSKLHGDKIALPNEFKHGPRGDSQIFASRMHV